MRTRLVARILGVFMALTLGLLILPIRGWPEFVEVSAGRCEPQKPDCDEYYPLPADYPNWAHCRNVGQTGCGGPAQCACDESQRLVTFKCDQGTYQQCFGEKGNGCKGN